MTGLRVIGDIGGTNARFAVADNGKYREVQHVTVDHYATIEDAIEEYLDGLRMGERPTSGAFAVAGPVFGDDVKLTNLNWSFSISELKSNLGLSELAVINDFAGTAMAVPYLPESDKFVIGNAMPQTRGPVGIVGPGTGLGMSSLVPNGKDWILLPGEGGHSTMCAANSRENQILGYLRARWQHVSAERVLSGAGLVNLYGAICALGGKKPELLKPAQVTERAALGSDESCVEAFKLFCAMLGNVAGNLALTVGATGGIYIAGGIVLRFKEAFATSLFRERFEAKGRLRDYVRRIPTYIILQESPALLGLANLRIGQ